MSRQTSTQPSAVRAGERGPHIARGPRSAARTALSLRTSDCAAAQLLGRAPVTHDPATVTTVTTVTIGTDTSSPTPPLTAGIVGAGWMGVVHTEALRRLGIPVKGVVGSTPERAREKAKTSLLPPVVDTYEELLADPEINVVHVTSPNYLHHVQVAAALDAGKHVVCEKPLAVSVDEGRDLVDRARKSGLTAAVCFNQRYYPMVQQAHALAAQGDLGKVRLVTGGYLQDWLLLESDWNWRLVAEKSGPLRAVADIGSHWFDSIEFVTGARITDVVADLHTFIAERNHPVGEVATMSAHTVAADAERVTDTIESDDGAGVLLRFDNGARGTCTFSQVSAGRKNFNNWEVDGSEAAIAWNSERPGELWMGHRSRANELHQRDAGLMYASAATTALFPAGHVEGYPDTFRALFAQIYAHIASGGPVLHPTFEDGLRSIHVCEAVAESARTRAWQPVSW